MAQTYYFSINMTPYECQALYTGQVNTVMATAHNGLRVQLPINNLRPFVSQIGIKGVFRMLVNDNNKIISFEQVK